MDIKFIEKILEQEIENIKSYTKRTSEEEWENKSHWDNEECKYCGKHKKCIQVYTDSGWNFVCEDCYVSENENKYIIAEEDLDSIVENVAYLINNELEFQSLMTKTRRKNDKIK